MYIYKIWVSKNFAGRVKRSDYKRQKHSCLPVTRGPVSESSPCCFTCFSVSLWSCSTVWSCVCVKRCKNSNYRYFVWYFNFIEKLN